MSQSEQFNLKWNDFQINVTSSYMELREDLMFADVTLACEGNQHIEAHKIILASASKVLKDILVGNKHMKPLLYMRGISFKDMLSVVDFIYHGQVNIDQEDLNDFLALAEDLQLKGLSGSKEFMDEKTPINETSKRQTKHTLDSQFVQPEKTEILESNLNEGKIIIPIDNSVGIFEDSIPSYSFKEDINQELNQTIKSMLRKVEGIWTCNVCGKTDNKNLLFNIKRHIEVHIEGISLPCGHCGKVFKSRHNLQNHIYRHNSEKPI